MKLGYFTLTDNPPAYGETRQDPNKMILSTVRECVHAEELGFNSVWVPEHHFGVFGVLPSPSLFLSHVAAKTSRVKLAPATVLLPTSHPLRMAEEYALLHLLSGGRAIFSAGRGYDEREYNAFGVDFSKSQEIFFEGMDIIKKAWTSQGEFSYEGKYYTLPPVPMIPEIRDGNYPDIYVASFSRPSLEKAAQIGENVIFAPFAATMVFGSVQNAVTEFKKISESNGYKGKKAMCSYFINVTESAEETEKTKQRMLKYFHGILPAFPSDVDKAPAHIRYFVDIVHRLKNMKTTDLSDKSIIVGEPEHCVNVLKQCEAAGIEEVILYFNFGGLDHKDTMKSMERVAKYVLPYFGKR